MGEFAAEVWTQVGITATQAVSVVLAAAVLYLVYTVILQVAGQRLTANPSVLSFSVMALLGALVARGILGHAPTVMGTVLAIATLLLLESALGHLRGHLRRALVPHGPQPTVVMIHGHLLPWQLRGSGLDVPRLLTLLRRAGVRDPAAAELVILEARGQLTVLRRGEQIAEELLQDVRGTEIIPASLRTSAGTQGD